MKVTAQEDIEAPAEHVYARISDFRAFERMIMRRGAEVTRLDTADPPETGSAWEVRFRLRGKDRKVSATLDRVDPPTGIALSFEGSQVTGGTEVDLVSLSPARTRLSLSVTAEARTIAARLLLPSMRLGKHKIETRLRTALAGFAEDLERKYRDGAA